MDNYLNGSEIPLGLGMALAENLPALQYFASLSPQQQQEVVNRTHSVNSKEEMQQLVAGRIAKVFLP